MSTWADLSDFVKLIVIGGGAGGLLILVRAYKALVELNMRKSDNQIARWQKLFERTDRALLESENEREYSDSLTEYYRYRAADLESVLRQHGLQPPAAAPLPTKKRLPSRRSYELEDTRLPD